MVNTRDGKIGRQLTFEDYLQKNSAEHEGYAEEPSHQSIVTKNDTSQKEGNLTLLDQVLDWENISCAIGHVISNAGAPGIDGMTVDDVSDYIKNHYDEICSLIRKRRYKPQPVKRVRIPKEVKGEFRDLSIPVVVDRVIQQAIAQVLTPIFDPTFSDNSFGFRPKRSCQMAIKRCAKFANEGYDQVVSVDLRKYFDTVPQSYLIRLLSKTIKDSDLISLIHKFLVAGVMDNGLVHPTEEGVPQGSPLSPLLSNIMLNELDQELHRRGHRFVRYADDFIIFCKSERSAKRVADSIIRYIEKELHLKVNRQKSTISSITEIKYLGYGFYYSNKYDQYRANVHPKSQVKIKRKIKKVLKKSSGLSYQQITKSLSQLVKGWINHFILADMRTFLMKLDEWMRHRIRALCWYRWKRPKTRFKKLIKFGMKEDLAVGYANTRKGTWATSCFQDINFTLDNDLIHHTWDFVSCVETFDYKRINYYNKIRKAKGLPLI